MAAAKKVQVELHLARETKNFAKYQPGDGNFGNMYLTLAEFNELGKPQTVVATFTAK